MSEDTISIITYDPSQASPQNAKVGGEKTFDTGLAPVPQLNVGRRSQDSQESTNTVEGVNASEVRVDKLEQEMSHLMDVVERLLAQTERRTGTTEIKLDEIELSVEINSQGKISLLGSGLLAGGKGAIKLKFKRQDIRKNG